MFCVNASISKVSKNAAYTGDVTKLTATDIFLISKQNAFFMFLSKF